MKTEVRQTFTCITIDLLIALIMFAGLLGSTGEAAKFIGEFALNFSISIVGLYAAGYFMAGKLSRLILQHNWNKYLAGALTMLVILFAGILAGSTVEFIEGLIRDGNVYENIVDYYFKPLYWVFFFGTVPTVVSGLALGYYIGKRQPVA